MTKSHLVQLTVTIFLLTQTKRKGCTASASKRIEKCFPRGHSTVKNTGGGGGSWLDSLGSGIWLGKDILGFFKNIDLDNRG